MSNTKISALPAGSPALSTDLLPIARSGANASLSMQNVLDFVLPPINVVVDYAADPTGTSDSTAAIQNALNAAATVKGTVFFPVGTYKISQLVLTTAHNGITLVGPTSPYPNTSNGAILLGTATGAMVTNFGSPGVAKVTFRGLGFNANSTATQGIYMDTTVLSIVDNCWFEGFAAGSAALYGGANLYTRVQNCLFDASAGYAIVMLNGLASSTSAGYYGCNDGWFQFNNFYTNQGLNVSGDNYFIYNDFEFTLNTPANAALDLSDTTTGAGVGKTTVHGNYMELIKGTCSQLRGIYGFAGNTTSTVSDNTLFGHATSDAGIAIDFSNSYSTNICVTGNSIREWGTGILWNNSVGATASPMVSGNFFGNVTTQSFTPTTEGNYASIVNYPPTLLMLDTGIYLLNKPIVGTAVKMASGTTAYDLSVGNQIYAQDAAPTTVTGVTNAVAGSWFWIVATTANTTLTNGAGAFVLALGSNYTMAAGQVIPFLIDAAGVIREIGYGSLGQPGGTVVTQPAFTNSTATASTAYADNNAKGVSVAGFREDFLGSGTNTTGLASTGSAFNAETAWFAAPIVTSAGSSVGAGTGTSFANPGGVELTSAAVSGDGAVLYKASGTLAAGGNWGDLGSNAGWEFNVVCKVVATTSICIRVGFCAASGQTVDPPINGIWVEYDTANANSNTDWTWVTQKASTTNYSTTNSKAPDTSFHHFRIRSLVAGTILFSVDGGTETSISTDVPTVALGLFMQVLTRTSSAASIVIDFVSYFAATGRT
jgi:hypothetical protein